MADYISKYSGAQIDLAVASGSTTTGTINLTEDQRIYFEADKGSWIESHAANSFRVVVGGNQMMLWDFGTGNRAVFGNNTKVYIGANNNKQPDKALVVDGDISGSATSTGSFGLIQTKTIENNGQIVISASASDVELGAKDDIVMFAQDDVKINSMDTTFIEARDDIRLLANNDIRLDCAQDGGGDIRIRFNNKNLLTNTGSGSLNVEAGVNLSGSATTTGSFGRVEAAINPSVLVYDTQTIAAAGANQYNATAISASSGPLVFVTGADNTKAVLLPKLSTVEIGQSFEIHNTVSNKTLEVFPWIGDKINPAADNAGITVAASTSLVVYKYNAAGWVGHETSPIGA